MAEADEGTPDTPSADYSAMAGFWSMVCAILSGVEALRQTAGNYQAQPVAGPINPVSSLSQLPSGRGGPVSPYLPKFPNETDTDYTLRRANAPLTNIYEDVSDNLASKPFTKTCQLNDKASDQYKKLAEEDIDGQHNSLHVFAKKTFKDGIDKGVDWILIDYTNVPPGATLADERSMGARPYWVHIPAERLLAVYSDFINGKELIVHARIHEPSKRREGYKEVDLNRVRIFNREPILDLVTQEPVAYQDATWELWEERTQDKKTNWVKISEGPITIKIIPMVAFVPGDRDGTSWVVKPPLKSIAYMQIEEFQQESGLKSIKELTAFPMLAGNGVTAPTGADGSAVVVPVGPKTVLFAPPSADGKPGEWKFIEPTAQSLTFLKEDLQQFRTEMRDLGKQPLASANLTVITTANVSMRAHSAVQAWAILLKDTLEQAWTITALWMKEANAKIEVNVHTDFGVDFEAGTELDSLLKAEGVGIISKETTFEEFKRRGVLSDDADFETEQERLAGQLDNATVMAEQNIDPKTGELIIPNPNPKAEAAAQAAARAKKAA